MHVSLLFVLFALVSLGGKVTAKLRSDLVLERDKTATFLLLTVNALLACFFFWLFGGFSLRFNVPTFFFSLIYAAVIAVILVADILLYDLADVSDGNVLLSFFSLVCTSLIARFFFGESLGTRELLRMGVLLVAVLLVFFSRRQKGEKKRKSSFRLLPLLILIVVSGSANVAVTKAFALSERVSDENSFFFLTNLLLGLGAGVLFFLHCRKNRAFLRDSLSLLTPRGCLAIGANTLFSNLGSLISLWILVRVDLAVAAPTTSGLGILAGVGASLLLRESLHFFSYLAALTALVAVIL